MNSFVTLLLMKMADAEPGMDVLGSDRKVLQLASKDFTNYLKCNWKECNVAERMEQLFIEEPVEFDSFLSVWVGMWLKKWKTRVKLIFGDQSQDSLSRMSEAMSKAEPLWRTLECKQEMTEILVAALVKNGEICGTEMLAEYLIKLELAKENSEDINSRERVFAILNSALRKAREMALGVGPLLFVAVDKGYYTTVKK